MRNLYHLLTPLCLAVGLPFVGCGDEDYSSPDNYLDSNNTGGATHHATSGAAPFATGAGGTPGALGGSSGTAADPRTDGTAADPGTHTTGGIAGTTGSGGGPALDGGPATGGGDPGMGGTPASGGSGGGTSTPNVIAPASTDVWEEYFVMGEMRLINNAWGSAEMGCDSHYEIFVNADKSFGWHFDRPSCGDDDGTKPDYPEVEFGMHAFGVNDALITSPDFSSTTLLPIQIKDVTSASVSVDNLTIRVERSDSWNLNLETWLCEQHPETGTHTNAYAELITFWGWQDGRWPCDVENDRMTAGDDTYTFCHQSDNWGGWRYFQFRVNNGPRHEYHGTVDIKATLDWLVNNADISPDLWISRFEIGTEIGDNSKGTVTMNSVTFEVNGESRSPEFGN